MHDRDPESEHAVRAALICAVADREVLTIAALDSGARFAVAGDPGAFSALVVEELPTEFRGFGAPEAVADLMARLTGWGCVEVEPEDAAAVAARLARTLGVPTSFYGSLSYELGGPVPSFVAPEVRTLDRDDGRLLRSADPRLGLGDLEPLLDDGLVVVAVIDGRIVARASCSARSRGYADIGVATLEEFRGRGFSTAVAAVLAHRLKDDDLIPVWSTGETNLASQRVATKLGFTLTGRRTYVLAERP